MTEETEWLFNTELAKKLHANFNTLQDLYVALHESLGRPMMFSDSPKSAAQRIEAIEYALQLAWGFQPAPEKHSYWFEIKGCSCPKMDNREGDARGRIIDTSCIFHGKVLDYWPEDYRFR